MKKNIIVLIVPLLMVLLQFTPNRVSAELTFNWDYVGPNKAQVDSELLQVLTWMANEVGLVDSNYCNRKSYGRGAGVAISVCPSGKVKIGALCYSACPSGMRREGVDCRSVCPEGMRDDGGFCRRVEYGRGGGYISKNKCEKAKGAGNCERNLARWYPKCRSGFSNFGCCFCRPKQPDCSALGLGTRLDLSCTKKTIIGDPKPLICADGLVNDAGLCYDSCRTDYHGVGPVCWQNCTTTHPTQCATGCATDTKACNKAIADQTLAILELSLSAATLGRFSEVKGVAKMAASAKTAGNAVGKVGMAWSATKFFFDQATDSMVRELDLPDNVRSTLYAQLGPEGAEFVIRKFGMILLAYGEYDHPKKKDLKNSLLELGSFAPAGIGGTIKAFNKPACFQNDFPASVPNLQTMSFQRSPVQWIPATVTAGREFDETTLDLPKDTMMVAEVCRAFDGQSTLIGTIGNMVWEQSSGVQGGCAVNSPANPYAPVSYNEFGVLAAPQGRTQWVRYEGSRLDDWPEKAISANGLEMKGASVCRDQGVVGYAFKVNQNCWMVINGELTESRYFELLVEVMPGPSMIERGFDRPGNDYRTIADVTDAKTCETACAGHYKCRAWSQNPSAKRCYLKAPAPNPVNVRTTCPTCSSGLNQNLMGPVELGTYLGDSNNYHYFYPTPADPAMCQTACANDNRCKSWSYAASQAVCYLKDAVPPALASTDGNASGIRRNSNSAGPSLRVWPETLFGDDIRVNFSGGTGNPNDRIAVYRGSGTQLSTNPYRWAYTNGTQTPGRNTQSGTLTFGTLATQKWDSTRQVAVPDAPALTAGDYSVLYFEAGGNTPIAGPVPVQVVLKPNIALVKPAVQTSVGWGGDPARAVDGNTDGIFENNSVSHTNIGTNEYWQVNLQGDFEINQVAIFNRTDDCCRDRIIGAKLQILGGANGQTVVWEHVINRGAATHTFVDEIPAGTIGRAVRVVGPAGGVVSLAEVKVYGQDASL